MSSTAWFTSVGSDSRMNKMTVVSDTGVNLAALDKTKHKLAVCTSTGSGFIVDHLYLASNDGSTWIDMGIINHYHTGTGDGGFIGDAYKENPTFCDLWLTKTDDLKRAQWNEVVTSTGSIADNTDGTTGERSIKLLTGATSGATATIRYPHLKLNWASGAIFQTKLRIETFSSIAIHSGINCDDTSAADSNTRKLQAELCTVTNNNWWLRTANGSANSASDTGIAGTANRVALRIKFNPGAPEARLKVDTGTELVKTTNIPTSTSTEDAKLIVHSVKNNTAADRPIHMYGSRVAFTISDNWV